MNRPSRHHALRFFSSLLLSAFGYEFIFFVMTVHLYGLSKNALSIGIFTTLTFVPRLFSSLLGGLADRFGKGSCLSLSALALVVLFHLMSRTSDIETVYALWCVAGFFLTLIVNARGALMAEIVTGERYASGNALSLALLNGAKLLAPLLGGLVSASTDIASLLHFTCLIYLLTAVAAIRIDSAAQQRRNDAGFLHNAARGFKFMRENRVFARMAAIAFCWRLFLGLQTSLFVVYAKDTLQCSDGQYGVFAALIGIGSVTGSALGPFVAKRLRPAPLIRWGLSLHYASFILLGLCRDYGTALAIVFLSYLVFYVTLVGLHCVRDRTTLAEIRSSAYGTVTAILTPAAIASMLAGGYLASLFGAPGVLAAAGLLALASLHALLAAPAALVHFDHARPPA